MIQVTSFQTRFSSQIMLGGLGVIAGAVVVGGVVGGSWPLALPLPLPLGGLGGIGWVTGKGWAEALPVPRFLELLGVLAMGGHCEEARSRAERRRRGLSGAMGFFKLRKANMFYFRAKSGLNQSQ